MNEFIWNSGYINTHRWLPRIILEAIWSFCYLNCRQIYLSYVFFCSLDLLVKLLIFKDIHNSLKNKQLCSVSTIRYSVNRGVSRIFSGGFRLFSDIFSKHDRIVFQKMVVGGLVGKYAYCLLGIGIWIISQISIPFWI